MNYVRTILITTILLNVYNLYNAESATTQPLSQSVEQSTEQDIKIEEKNEQQEWDSHLTLLKTEGQHWDKAHNIPDDPWKNDAFDVAEKIIKKDNNLVSTLKSTFFDAITAKIELEKGKFSPDTFDLIAEFNKKIDDATTSAIVEVPQEKKEESKIVTPTEPISEPTPSSTPGTPAVTETESSSSSSSTSSSTAASETPDSTQQTSKDLETEWKELLEAIKTEESIVASLNRAYEVAQELLLSGKLTQQKLEKTFIEAMEIRGRKKRLEPHTITNEINVFRTKIARQEQLPYYQPPVQPHLPLQQDVHSQQEALAMKQVQDELAAKNALLQEEREQQKQKELQVQAALALAREREVQSNQKQESEIQKLQIQMQQKIAQAEAESRQRERALAEEMRETLAKHIKQMAALQKPAAEKVEKGIFSNITETVSNWWYGKKAQAPTQVSSEKQEELLNAITNNRPDAKESFKQFQHMLLTFEPNNATWIERMQQVLYAIVITHEIMSLDEISAIAKDVLVSSGKISQHDPQGIIPKIGARVREKQVEEQRQKDTREALNQRRKEKKEEIALAQQKIKDEEDRREREKQHVIKSAASYKDEKKQWYELLGQVAQNKQATPHDNHALTQEALKKSQSLLQLAHNIPTKNKTAISQKLKQKFSLALLEQQKNGENPVNIHHNMDIFNNEINKMTD